MYDSNLKNDHNLYLIPLKNVRGQISPVKQEGTGLKISLCFQNNPRPTNVKIYGVPNSTGENEKIIEKNLKACEEAFTNVFTIENTQIKYYYIHTQTNSVLAKQRKDRGNLKLKQKLNINDTHRKPILALTDL